MSGYTEVEGYGSFIEYRDEEERKAIEKAVVAGEVRAFNQVKEILFNDPEHYHNPKIDEIYRFVLSLELETLGKELV